MQAESHPIEREAPTAQPLGAAPPVQSQLSEPQPNLPSRLRAVSTVSNARLILAIDSAGTLFLSKDSGKRWQAVTPRWTGRAVRVNSSFAVPRTEPAAPLIHSAPIAKAPAATAAGAVFTSEPAESGSLSGTVTDPTGAVIPNARVTVTNTVTSQTLSTVTDSTGLYVFMGLIPGVYRLEAQARGFQTFVRHGITVAASEKALASFSLTIGAETQTVSVQADSLAIETESSVVSGSISSEKPADAHPPAFELTTDTGQVWISSDGRHWKRK